MGINSQIKLNEFNKLKEEDKNYILRGMVPYSMTLFVKFIPPSKTQWKNEILEILKKVDPNNTFKLNFNDNKRLYSVG